MRTNDSTGSTTGTTTTIDAAAPETPIRRRSVARPLAVAAVGALILALAGSGVRATLSAIAEADDPTTITSGTLLLTLAPDGVGLETTIEDLAPGDTVDRFVDLTNAGTLAATGLSVVLATSGDAVLVTDGTAPATTRALTLTVDACATDWDVTASTCAGGATTLLSATTLATLVADAQSLGLSFEPGETVNLRLRFTLPDQDETSVNGQLPDPTIQGASVDITTTFRVEQRDPVASSG
jgi:hypothetical protein